MEKQFRIYQESYCHLPERFQKKIEWDIRYLLKMELPVFSKVFLFGSCARGDIRSGSDIDLLILTKQKISDRMLVSQIRSTLDEEINGVHTDVTFMNEETIKEETVFKKMVRRDKKIILEVLE